jgi:hypothetical protein
MSLYRTDDSRRCRETLKALEVIGQKPDPPRWEIRPGVESPLQHLAAESTRPDDENPLAIDRQAETA